MKKKLLSLALVLAMALTMLPTMALAADDATLSKINGTLSTATLHDTRNEAADKTGAIKDDNSLATGYKLGTPSIDNGVVVIPVQATNVKKHQNARNKMGYWVGVHIGKPTGANYISFGKGSSSSGISISEPEEDTELNYWVDASVENHNANNFYFRLAWYKDSDTGNQKEEIYDAVFHLDITDVYTEEAGTPAALTANSEINYINGSPYLPLMWTVTDVYGEPIVLPYYLGKFDITLDSTTFKADMAMPSDADTSGERVPDAIVTCSDGGIFSVNLPISQPLIAGTHPLIIALHGEGSIKANSTVVVPFEQSSGSVGGSIDAIDPGDVSSAEDAAAVIESVQSSITQDETDAMEEAINAYLSGDESASQEDLDAGKEIMEQLADLDKAVREAAKISVYAEAKAGAPTNLDADNIKIANGALNAKEGAYNTGIVLQAGPSEGEHTINRKYNSANAVSFSMTMSNVANAHSLKIPVVLTFPVPSGMSPSKVRVLHYTDSRSDSADVIVPKYDSKNITFAVKSFSDFVLVEVASTSSGSSGHGVSASDLWFILSLPVPGHLDIHFAQLRLDCLPGIAVSVVGGSCFL